jgi:hypothetical protein
MINHPPNEIEVENARDASTRTTGGIIGIEINEKYVQIINRRIAQDARALGV